MSRMQYLLLKIAEECYEVAQRALKAAQFGINETQQGQELDNFDRLAAEFQDLLGVCAMMEDETGRYFIRPDPKSRKVKIAKVEKYLLLSQSLGMVD